MNWMVLLVLDPKPRTPKKIAPHSQFVFLMTQCLLLFVLPSQAHTDEEGPRLKL